MNDQHLDEFDWAAWLAPEALNDTGAPSPSVKGAHDSDHCEHGGYSLYASDLPVWHDEHQTENDIQKNMHAGLSVWPSLPHHPSRTIHFVPHQTQFDVTQSDGPPYPSPPSAYQRSPSASSYLETPTSCTAIDTVFEQPNTPPCSSGTQSGLAAPLRDALTADHTLSPHRKDKTSQQDVSCQGQRVFRDTLTLGEHEDRTKGRFMTHPSTRTASRNRQTVSNYAFKVSKTRQSRHNSKQSASSTVIIEDSKGNVQHVFRVSGTEKGRPSSESRSATKLARRIGSCVRCREHKKRCRPSESIYDACQTCKATPWHLLRRPCTRFEILHLNLHRRGSTTNDNLTKWMAKQGKRAITSILADGPVSQSHTKTITLTQKMGGTLNVTISTFVQFPGNVISYAWKDTSGNEHSMVMPPYYISDMKELKENLRTYVERTAKFYMQSLLAGANPIVHDTFKEACRVSMSRTSRLVTVALRFWAATRLTEIVWTISGGESIDFVPSQDPENPWYNTVPVTPLMDTQLDEVTIREIVIPLRDELLKLLEEKVLERKKENFLEIYLAIFVIMNSFEFVFSDVVDYTTRHGMTKSNGGSSLCEGYVHACKALLSYFHFASEGARPFSDELDKQSFPSYITPEQAKFVETIRQGLRNQEYNRGDLQQASMYHSAMYWCSQMFHQGWSGDWSPACEILPFSEEDFLTS